MIDYAALLGATAGIQVAKANYDATRDNPQMGWESAETEVIPAGAIILGTAMYTDVAFTFDGVGYIDWIVKDFGLGTVDPVLNHLTVAWMTGAEAFITFSASALSVLIGDADVLTGKARIWVFYLPT